MKPHPLALAVAALGAGLPISAFSADAGSDKQLAPVSVSIDREVDVQARTELGRLTEATPISGAVLDREELEHLQLVNNLLEMGKRIPGISMVRNMRIPDGGKLYTENRIDGMRATAVNTSILDEVDPADIERIDVITGPASALYGSGAFGGTISVFTRQPPKDFKAGLSQEFGSWGFKRSKLNAGASFADGRVGFIVTGSDMDNDGWRLSNAGGAPDAAAEHKKGTALRVQVQPTDSTKFQLGYGELKYDYRWAGPLRMTKFDQDWRQTEAGTYGQYIDEYKTSSYRLQQLIGERGEFTFAHTRIANAGINNGNGGSGGSNNIICDDGTTAANGAPAAGKTVVCKTYNNNSGTITNTIKPTNTVTKTSLAMYRQEFDLAKTTAYVGTETIEITADTETYNNSYTALQAQAGMWSMGTRTTTGQGSLTATREETPFVHVEFSPIERLRLHVGERFGRITYNVDDRTTSNRDVTNMLRKGNVKRVGATFDLAPKHLVWANYGETFNPQSTGSLTNTAAVGTANNVIGVPLEPERGKTREIGFRGRFDDLGLRYDITLFHGATRGFIVTRTCTAAEQAALNGGAACTINDAAGMLTTKGLESMFSWAATKWLDLGATYTNAVAVFNDYKVVGTSAFDYVGKSYQAMPRTKLNLRAGIKPAPGWLVELEGDHISSYYVDNTNQQGSYTRPDLFNLRASYKDKDWSFWLHAINLTDKKYATRVQLSTVAGVSNTLSTQAGQGNAGSYAPLTFRAGVTYNF